ILEDGIMIAGKSMREHLEAINHRQAIILTEEIVKNKETLSERLIKELHAIILYGIDQSNAGLNRKHNVIISGANHTPPNHIEVPQLMAELMVWYNKKTSYILLKKLLWYTVNL